MLNNQSTEIIDILERTKIVIEEISVKTKTISETSESDFLKIGGELYGISEQANKISSLASNCSELLVGEKTKLIFNTLRAKLKNLDTYYTYSLNEIEKDKELLNEVLLAYNAIDGPLKEFRHIVKHLKLLSVSIRIESVRLSSENKTFEVLAAEVLMLAGKAEEIFANITNIIQIMYSTVDELLKEIDFLKNEQYKKAQQKIEPITEILENYWEEQNKYSHVSQKISNLMSDNSDSVGQIVVSLQSHDFARQKLEHVIEALDNHYFPPNSNNQFKNLDELIYNCTNVSVLSKLQIDQLNDTDKAIQESANNVKDKLNAIYSNTIALGNETNIIEKSSTMTGQDTITNAGGEVNEIVISLLATVETHKSINAKIGNTLDLIESVKNELKNVEELDIVIKVLTYNGLIHASRAGNEGAALKVIAGSIQELSNDSQRQVKIFSSILENVSEHSNKVKLGKSDENSGEDSDATQDTIQDISKELTSFFSQLESMDGNMCSSIEEFQDTTTGFNNSLHSLINSITISEEFNKSVSELTHKLESVIESVGLFVDEKIREQIIDDLKNSTTMYTMEREREVHEHSLAGNIENIEGDGLDADDNVELF